MKKNNTSEGLCKKELLFIVSISFAIVLMHLPFFSQPLISDELTFAELIDNVYMTGSHTNPLTDAGGQEFDLKPPSYVFANMPLMFLFNDSFLALRATTLIVNILIAITAFMFIRRLNFGFKWSAIMCAMIVFNPWFFYFVKIAVAHGLSSLLVLAGIYFIFFYENNLYLYALGGVLLSTAYLARYDPIAFCAAFGLYALYRIIKKKNVKANVIFIIALAILPLANTIHDYYRYDTIMPPRLAVTYEEEFDVIIKDAEPYSQKFVFSAKNFVKLLLFYLPQYLMFTGILLLIGVYFVFRRKNILDSTGITIKWRFVLLAAVLQMIIFSYFVINNWSAFPSLFLPLLLFSLHQSKNIKKRYHKFIKLSVLMTIIISIPIFMILNYGSVKDVTDRVVHLRPLLNQRVNDISSAAKWSNSNLPHKSNMVTNFNLDLQILSVDLYYNKILRKDINHYSLFKNVKEGSNLLKNDYDTIIPTRFCTIKYGLPELWYYRTVMENKNNIKCLPECNILDGKNTFIISDQTEPDTLNTLKDICNNTLSFNQVFITKAGRTRIFEIISETT